MRTFDTEAINRLANHPDVVRQMAWIPEDHPETDGWLLLGPQVEMPEQYVFLMSDNGELCALFEWSGPGIWQVHMMSYPWFRGKDMFKAARKLIHEMFYLHGADLIWGQLPLHNRAARMFARLVFGKPLGFGHHHVVGDVEYFRNTRDRWTQEHWDKNPIK